MCNAKRFGKEDWFAFAGASKHKDGRDPVRGTCMLDDGRAATFIFAGEGLEVLPDLGRNDKDGLSYRIADADMASTMAAILSGDEVRLGEDDPIVGDDLYRERWKKMRQAWNLMNEAWHRWEGLGLHEGPEELESLEDCARELMKLAGMLRAAAR
jgi:hypothetical protein